MKTRGPLGGFPSLFPLILGLCLAVGTGPATLAQAPLSRHTPEGALLEWSLPEALGNSAARLERIDPAVPTGGHTTGVWANDRWLLSATAPAGALSVFQITAPGTVEAVGPLAVDPVSFGEIAQAVIKQDDAILIARTGQVLVYRLRTVAEGGPVQVGQLVGPLPTPEFRLTGVGRRSGPGPSVDYLYVPAGADGVALYDLTLEWFPRAVRNLRETRRFGVNGLEASEPLAPPTAVAALTDVLAIATGGRDIRLVEEFFFSQWETIDRGRWQAGVDETIAQIYGRIGRLYAVVQSPAGQRLQVLALSGKQLIPNGSLALPAGSQVTALEPFGPNFLAVTTGTGGTLAVNITDDNQPSLVASLATLDAAEANALTTQFPHLWVNDRSADLSPVVLGNGDSALARYALEGQSPPGLTLSAEGALRWTPDESQGGSLFTVGFTRTVQGTIEHHSAELIVDEANQSPVIAPVPEQFLVAGQAWTVNVAVTDPDVPAQLLSLATDRPEISVGARALDGAFPLAWTPAQAANRSMVTVVARDDAGGAVTNIFAVTVASNFQRFEPTNTLTWTEQAAPEPTNSPVNLIRPRDGRRATFSVVDGQLPPGITLDPNGAFNGVPDERAGRTNAYEFRVQAVLVGETNSAVFVVTVNEAYGPPNITPIADQVYAYDQRLLVTVEATDPDEDTASFEITANAVSENAAFPDLGELPVNNLGQIDWTPNPAGPALGSYRVTVTVTELGTNGPPRQASQVTFRLSPTLEHLAPFWAAPGPLIQLRASEGQPLEFPLLHVFDPNGRVGPIDSFGTLGPQNVPGFPFAAQADGSYQVPAWTPREDAGGRTWLFTVVAHDFIDPGLTATNTIEVAVAETDQPPVWRAVPVQSGVVRQQLDLDLAQFVADADRLWIDDRLVPDPLTFQIVPGQAIAGAINVSPDGRLSWTPAAYDGCAVQTLRVAAIDSTGNRAVGLVPLTVQPLIPLASNLTNEVRNGVLGWNLSHDLHWLDGQITNVAGTCNERAACFLKAYRSLSWPGARADVPSVRQLDSRGAARLTALAALPGTSALLGAGMDNGELWLRFGEYYLPVDQQGRDWDYNEATQTEWRNYSARNNNERAEIWFYNPAGNSFRLARTIGPMPNLHLEIEYHELPRLDDDVITAQSADATMEESFVNADGANAAEAAFAQGLAAILAGDLAGKRLSFRMDRLSAADTDDLAQAGIQCAFLDPRQPMNCNGGQVIAPMGLFRANGAILLSGCNDVSATNQPPDLQPIGLILASPGQALAVQLRATDPDLPPQALTFSLDAESVRRGIQVDPVSGLLTWNVPADAGCTEISGTATVQDPEPLSDSEPFTIRIAPRQFSVPFSGGEPEHEGMLATESAGGHILDWLPAADGALPAVAANRWSSPDAFPVYADHFHPNAPAPIRGAHFTLGDRNTLPRTQRVLRERGLDANSLGFRFDLRLAQDRQGLDWGYDDARTTEWRHYVGHIEFTLGDTTLYHIPDQALSVTLAYGAAGNAESNHISAASGIITLGHPAAPLNDDALAVADALQADLGDGLTRLTFAAIQPALTLDLIDKGFPVTWFNLTGALEVSSCEPPYVAPYLVSPGSVIVAEGAEASVDLRVIPANAANLQFRLIAPADPQMRVTAERKFVWLTDEADGGRSEVVTIEMTDGIVTTETSFTVTVTELNSPPTLTPVEPQFVSAGALLRLQLAGRDPDRPFQRLHYRLVSGPAGMLVDEQGGLLTWRPGWAVPNGASVHVEVAVDDQRAEATTAFSVTVLPSLVQRFQMRAMDGYLAGATVWWDANRNDLLDAGEPNTVTDRKGEFDLVLELRTWDRDGDDKLGPSDGRIVARGGLDLTTGLTFAGQLTAPADAAVISPLTTLIEQFTRSRNVPESAVQDRVRDLFGLPDGLDLGAFDPLPAAQQSDPVGQRVQAANVIIADTVSQLAELLEGRQSDLPPGRAYEAVFKAWTDSLAQPPAGAPGATEWVRELLDHSAAALGVPMPEPLADVVADVIGAQNDAKRDTASTRDGLERLARLQAGSLVDTAPALRALGGNVRDGDDVRLGQSGWLRQSLASLGSGDPLGTSEAPGQFGLSRTNLTVREDGSADHVLAVVRSGGAAGPAAVELALRDTAGLLRTNRLSFEFKDGERFRTIDWTSLLANDTAANPGRTVTVTLIGATSNPAGATVRGDLQATATILDDDSVGSLAFATAAYRHDPTGTSPLSLVRTGGIAGRLVAQIDFAAGNDAVGTDLPPPTLIEFPSGVSRRLVLLPNLTMPPGTTPALILKLSLAAGSVEGGTVGSLAEVRVEYAAAGAPAKIVRLEPIGNGAARITLTGAQGIRHRLESSANLRTWFPVTAAGEIITQGESPVSGEVPVGISAEFFRVRPVEGQ